MTIETLAISLALLAHAAGGGVNATVVPRGGEPAFDVVDAVVSDAGVGFSVGGKRQVLGWDRVRELTGEAAGEFEPYRDLSERVWRARFRVERGDFENAEPLLEELATTYALKSGPTAGVIHAGMLRCRVERGATASAVIPWLHFVASGDDLSSSSSLLSMGRFGMALIDAEMMLAPELPPIWLDLPATRAIARVDWPLEATETDPASRRRAAVLGQLYYRSLRDEIGMPIDGALPSAGADPGLQFVREIVLARVGNAQQRMEMRDSLRSRLTRPHALWVRAWTNAAIGRSLLRETETEDKLLGIGYLLEVPATVPEASTHLTGVCLAEAAAALAALGDAAGAERIRQELLLTQPEHPALEWAPVRRIGSTKSGSTPGATAPGGGTK